MKQSKKCLLIGGAGHTGKSRTIRNLVADFLRDENGFEILQLIDTKEIMRKHDESEKIEAIFDENEIKQIVYKKEKDYFCIAQKGNIKIIISTASDNKIIIDNFYRYCIDNKTFNFIVAPIRNENDILREDLKNVIKKLEIKFKENVIEIPLAKIYKDKHKKELYDKDKAFIWYMFTIYLLSKEILQHFFNI